MPTAEELLEDIPEEGVLEAPEAPERPERPHPPDLPGLAPDPITQQNTAIGRVTDRAVKGSRELLKLGSFGFKPETERFFREYGILGPKERPTGFQRIGRALLEGPVQAFDLMAAGFVGALDGLGQIAREFGASDTSVKKIVNDVHAALTGGLGLISGAVSRAATAPARQAMQNITVSRKAMTTPFVQAVPAAKRADAAAVLEAASERFSLGIGRSVDETAAATVLTRTEGIKARFFEKYTAVNVAAKRGKVPPVAGSRDISEAFLEMRLLRGLPGVVEAVLERGPIGRDKRGNVVFTGDKGLNMILKAVPKRELPDAAMYFLARRYREIRRKRPDVELPLEMDDLTIAQIIVTGQGKTKWHTAFREWNTYNRKNLDLAVDSGVISSARRDAFITAGGEYVPTYRVIELVESGQSVAARSVLKRLRGGPQNVAEIVDNMYRNTQMWVEMSMRNYAKRAVYDMIDKYNLTDFAVRLPVTKPRVRSKPKKDGPPAPMDDLAAGIPKDLIELPPGAPKGAAVDFVYRNGEQHFYQINDPHMIGAMLSSDGSVLPSSLRLAGGLKTVFTRLITAAPPFQMRNVTRDTATAFNQFGYGIFVPVADSLRGIWSRIRQDKNYWDASINGVMFSTMFKAEESIMLTARRRKFYENRGIPYNTVLDTTEKLLHWTEEATSAFELGARLRAFEKVAKKTGSNRLAGLEGREITADLAARGYDEGLRVFTETVPFLGANLAALEKTGRTFTRNPARTVARGVALTTIPTLTLYMMLKDDPQYQALPDWDKDLHWFIPTGTGFVRIPRNFEYGSIFGALPERFVEALEQRHGAKFADSFVRIITGQLGMNIVPQAIGPFIDQARNVQFPGRPIVSKRFVDKVRGSEQFTPYTSETMVTIARELREETGIEMSPQRAEALIKGYAGTLGGYMLAGVDALMPFKGEKPTPRLEDNPMIRAFYVGFPLRQTQFSLDFYKFLNETRLVAGSISKMAAEHRSPDLTTIEKRLQVVADKAENIAEQVATWASEDRRIRMHPQMSAKAKARKIDQLIAQRNKLFRDFMLATPESLRREMRMFIPPK